jgi:hypothetical protein
MESGFNLKMGKKGIREGERKGRIRFSVFHAFYLHG